MNGEELRERIEDAAMVEVKPDDDPRVVYGDPQKIARAIVDALGITREMVEAVSDAVPFRKGDGVVLDEATDALRALLDAREEP